MVLAVRADFEARSAEYPLLARAVQDRYLVTAMTERQLRLVITEPAKKVDSDVDEDLVTVLRDDIRGRALAWPPWDQVQEQRRPRASCRCCPTSWTRRGVPVPGAA